VADREPLRGIKPHKSIVVVRIRFKVRQQITLKTAGEYKPSPLSSIKES